MRLSILRKNRILTLVMAIALVFSMCCGAVSVPTFAASGVICGQASSGETGSYNQTAGDQTGKEVRTEAWNYNSKTRHWTLVARPKNTAVAKKIAQVVKDACENDHVGYDRADGDIKSFYNALAGSGWDASKIAINCETTCTPLIAAAINAAGISCSAQVSASKFETLFKTGALSNYFTVYTTSAYVASSQNLKAGDILITNYKGYQHGCVVVSSPNSPTLNAVSHKAFTPSGRSNLGYKVGGNYLLKENMNVRYGPSKSYGIRKYSELSSDGRKHALIGTNAVLAKGTEITISAVNGDWLMIPSGWICGGTASDKNLTPKKTSDATTTAVKATVTTKSTSKATSKASTKVTIKVGKDYKLKKALYVRKGPGTNYAAKKRSSLSKSAKKHAVKGIKKAKFKKGTVVTCLKKKGDWMKVPSGWICCKKGNVANA